MTLHTIVSQVRGGGAVGGSAWVAKITGLDERFGLSRQFLKKIDDRSGSGRSGSMRWEIDEAGIYEFRGVGCDGYSIAKQMRMGGGESGFIRVAENGDVTDLTKKQVLAAFSGV